MSYTKGEWKVYNGHDGEFYHEPYIITELDPTQHRAPYTIARMLRCGNDGEDRAHAHLIAAAPDCHRELKNLVTRIEQGLALGDKLDLEPARKALAKVEGK